MPKHSKTREKICELLNTKKVKYNIYEQLLSQDVVHCQACNKTVNIRAGHEAECLDQHAGTTRHKKVLEQGIRMPTIRQSFTTAEGSVKQLDSFNMDMTRAMIEAGIPLEKASHPSFKSKLAIILNLNSDWSHGYWVIMNEKDMSVACCYVKKQLQSQLRLSVKVKEWIMDWSHSLQVMDGLQDSRNEQVSEWSSFMARQQQCQQQLLLNGKRNLKIILKNHDPHDVFNADELGLFYKTHAVKKSKLNSGKSSKICVTVLVGAKMTGDEKLPLLVIGKSAKPRCFKWIKKTPIHYEYNSKSWMTSVLFVDYRKGWTSRWFCKDGKFFLSSTTVPVTHIHSHCQTSNSFSFLQTQHLCSSRWTRAWLSPSKIAIAGIWWDTSCTKWMLTRTWWWRMSQSRYLMLWFGSKLHGMK